MTHIDAAPEFRIPELVLQRYLLRGVEALLVRYARGLGSPLEWLAIVDVDNDVVLFADRKTLTEEIEGEEPSVGAYLRGHPRNPCVLYFKNDRYVRAKAASQEVMLRAIDLLENTSGESSRKQVGRARTHDSRHEKL